MFTTDLLNRLMAAVDCCPWGSSVGRSASPLRIAPPRSDISRAIYTDEQRARRDASPWTIVQGVLAPVQFIVFLVSVVLVCRYLLTGDGLSAATFSIIVKTLVLYTIMITGSIWEHQIFGRYLFAPAFFWEDAVSMIVLALHTAYLMAFLTGALDPHAQMQLALAAYASYAINAAQFVLKLRAARRPQTSWNGAAAIGA